MRLNNVRRDSKNKIKKKNFILSNWEHKINKRERELKKILFLNTHSRCEEKRRIVLHDENTKGTHKVAKKVQ